MKRVVGNPESKEGVRSEIQCACMKKLLGFVQKVSLGAGNVVVLDTERSYTQKKLSGKKTRIDYGIGQCVMGLCVPAEEQETESEANNFTWQEGESESRVRKAEQR